MLCWTLALSQRCSDVRFYGITTGPHFIHCRKWTHQTRISTFLSAFSKKFYEFRLRVWSSYRCCCSYEYAYDHELIAALINVFTSCKKLVKIGPVIVKLKWEDNTNCTATRPQFDDCRLFRTLAFWNGLEYHNFDFSILIGNHLYTWRCGEF